VYKNHLDKSNIALYFRLSPGKKNNNNSITSNRFPIAKSHSRHVYIIIIIIIIQQFACAFLRYELRRFSRPFSIKLTFALTRYVFSASLSYFARSCLTVRVVCVWCLIFFFFFTIPVRRGQDTFT
jgi:hypothetical protein